MKTRYLTVIGHIQEGPKRQRTRRAYRDSEPRKRTVILLRGRWLERLGFLPGTIVRVQSPKKGVLTVTKTPRKMSPTRQKRANVLARLQQLDGNLSYVKEEQD